MKTFTNTCAQGDIYFKKITELPQNLEEVFPENNVLIVTHSETGHHHVMEVKSNNVKMYAYPNSIMDCFLVIKEPTVLRHLRNFDQHQDIKFEKGIYHGKRQREYTPEGFRKVQD